jgi:hypothetical protein
VNVLLTRQTPKKGPAYVLRDGAVQVRLAHTGDLAAELARLSAALCSAEPQVMTAAELDDLAPS